jgi:hypothetical protein
MTLVSYDRSSRGGDIQAWITKCQVYLFGLGNLLIGFSLETEHQDFVKCFKRESLEAQRREENKFISSAC